MKIVPAKLFIVRKKKRLPFMAVGKIDQEPPLKLGRRKLKSDNMQIEGELLDPLLRVRKVGRSIWRATEFEIDWPNGVNWAFKAYVIDMDKTGENAMLTIRPASQIKIDGKTAEEIAAEFDHLDL